MQISSDQSCHCADYKWFQLPRAFHLLAVLGIVTRVTFFPNLALNRLQVSILEPVEFMFSTMKILSSVLTRAMLMSYHDSSVLFLLVSSGITDI